jgi:hypothetical protein
LPQARHRLTSSVPAAAAFQNGLVSGFTGGAGIERS